MSFHWYKCKKDVIIRYSTKKHLNFMHRFSRINLLIIFGVIFALTL